MLGDSASGLETPDMVATRRLTGRYGVYTSQV
jgi:hypothetical protein